jgi:hypothetical protein
MMIFDVYFTKLFLRLRIGKKMIFLREESLNDQEEEEVEEGENGVYSSKKSDHGKCVNCCFNIVDFFFNPRIG